LSPLRAAGGAARRAGARAHGSTTPLVVQTTGAARAPRRAPPRAPRRPPPIQVRCLLRVSIYHVSFLRNLFPQSMFSAATMNNLGARPPAGRRAARMRMRMRMRMRAAPPLRARGLAPGTGRVRWAHAEASARSGCCMRPLPHAHAATGGRAWGPWEDAGAAPRPRELRPTMQAPAPAPAGGFTVQMLGGEGVALSDDAQQLKDWVEKGEGRGGALAARENRGRHPPWQPARCVDAHGSRLDKVLDPRPSPATP
jgi:hypothetical protein